MSYDLEERTLMFARRSRDFIKQIPRTFTNIEYGKQFVRASSSPGANYIEANESLSKKDFVMRIKICKKEIKECRYWLELIDIGNIASLKKECGYLQQEVTELMKIFGAILEKSK